MRSVFIPRCHPEPVEGHPAHLRLHLLLPLFLYFLTFPLTAQHTCQHFKQQIGSAKGGGTSIELWPADILHQKITLDLTLGNVIAGACEVTAVPRDASISELQLHLLTLTVDSVTSQNGTHSFTHAGELLSIDLGTTLSPADTFSLTVHYHGDPVTDPSGFGGFYTTANYIYNLGVAFEYVPHSFARAWFPCVDNFTERNTYEFFIKTAGSKNAWCNGELVGETQLGGDTLIRHWRKDLTIPSYLAAVAASNYTAVRDTFPSITGTEVLVVLVARPQDTTNMKNSFVNLQTAFDHFEEWFGHYRWNKVGYVATPVGAMEHSTSIHYPVQLLNGNTTYEKTMAHELAHEWFGNLVTCERAEEMYINEGFAEYLSHLFVEAQYGRDAYMSLVKSNHRDMVHRAHLNDEGWWALADVPQQWTYGDHSYRKGAAVLHSLRGYLGDDLFIAGLTSFLNDHAFQPVNSIMLRDHLTATTGVDMTDFFADHIFQPGWAAFEVDSFSVASGNVTTIHVQQKLRGANTLYNNVPLTVTCIDQNGDRWDSPDRIIVGGETSSGTVTPPFTPVSVLLNADQLLNLAITADEDTLPATSTAVNIGYQRSNIRLTPTQLAEPLPIRIEQYWVAADQEAQDQFAFVISPDRWWRIIADIPPDAMINARIDYDARPTTAGSLDVELMQNFSGIPFREDSLVLLYRPDQHSPWLLHPSFSIEPLTSMTDGWGRMNFTGVLAGEYTLGWRKSAVGIAETMIAPQWTIHPNPAQEQVTLSRDAIDPGTIELLDQKGRLVRWNTVQGQQIQFDLTGLRHGTYHFRFRDRNGKVGSVGKVVVTR